MTFFSYKKKPKSRVFYNFLYSKLGRAIPLSFNFNKKMKWLESLRPPPDPPFIIGNRDSKKKSYMPKAKKAKKQKAQKTKTK